MLAARFIRRYSSSIRSSNDIRSAYLNFYKSEGHVSVPSAKVVRPGYNQSDPFVTPDLNQFRGIMTGKEKTNLLSPRVVQVQKYLNHNSFDEVGKDLNTLSFYEVMSSWAFNNAYGKEKACQLAWTFLTKIMKIPKDHLSVTYFGGTSAVSEDYVTRQIWRRIGVPDSSIHPMSDEAHFYVLDKSGFGPAGVTTKIHHKRIQDACLWNIDFTEYMRREDGRVLTLDTMHVESGVRLEDLARVKQGASSVFETDLILPIIRKIEQVSRKKYDGRVGADPRHPDNSFRVVADVMRAACIISVDLHRSISHYAAFIISKQLRIAALRATLVLGAPRYSLKKLVPAVVGSLGNAYPELRHDKVQKVIGEALDSYEKMGWAAYDKMMAGWKQHNKGNAEPIEPELICLLVAHAIKYNPPPTRKAINFIRSTIGI